MQYFVDETKAKSYLLAVVAVPDDAVNAVRREVSRLVLPGQRSVHMKLEGDRRKRTIADTVARLSRFDVHATILDAGRGPETQRVRRQRALRAVVARAVVGGERCSLTFDLDSTLLHDDRQTLLTATRIEGARDRLSYRHLPFASEPLLTLPDVIAWCWAGGNNWHRRIAPVVAEVTDV